MPAQHVPRQPVPALAATPLNPHRERVLRKTRLEQRPLGQPRHVQLAPIIRWRDPRHLVITPPISRFVAQARVVPAAKHQPRARESAVRGDLCICGYDTLVLHHNVLQSALLWGTAIGRGSIHIGRNIQAVVYAFRRTSFRAVTKAGCFPYSLGKRALTYPSTLRCLAPSAP